MQVSSSVVEVFIKHINVTILSGVDYDTWSCQCFIEPSVSKILNSSLFSSLNLDDLHLPLEHKLGRVLQGYQHQPHHQDLQR